MKSIIGLMVVLAITTNVNAQSSKSKAKDNEHKVKHKTQNKETKTPERQVSGSTQSGTIGSGALPAEGVIVYDSTTSSDYHYNPYRKFTPAESVPEDPAPGFENVDEPRNRLPNTDKLKEPRK